MLFTNSTSNTYPDPVSVTRSTNSNTQYMEHRMLCGLAAAYMEHRMLRGPHTGLNSDSHRQGTK